MLNFFFQSRFNNFDMISCSIIAFSIASGASLWVVLAAVPLAIISSYVEKEYV